MSTESNGLVALSVMPDRLVVLIDAPTVVHLSQYWAEPLGGFEEVFCLFEGVAPEKWFTAPQGSVVNCVFCLGVAT